MGMLAGLTAGMRVLPFRQCCRDRGSRKTVAQRESSISGGPLPPRGVAEGRVRARMRKRLGVLALTRASRTLSHVGEGPHLEMVLNTKR